MLPDQRDGKVFDTYDPAMACAQADEANALISSARSSAIGADVALDPREDGGQSVIIVLRPLIARMIVAIRAPQPHAQQHFADILRRVARSAGGD